MTEKLDNIKTEAEKQPNDEVQRKRKSDKSAAAQDIPLVKPEAAKFNPYVDPAKTQNAANAAALFAQQYAEESKAQQAMDESQRQSDAEAERVFQQYLDSQVNTILPNVKDDALWRYCWVTTDTHLGGDNVQTRLRGGWILVKWGEVPGLTPDVMNNRSATVGDIVTFNEMALMKIPRKVWEKIMTYHHHTAPLEQEASIKARITGMVGDRSKVASPEYVSPDVQGYGQTSKKPKF